MNGTATLAAVLGAGTGLGLALAVYGLAGRHEPLLHRSGRGRGRRWDLRRSPHAARRLLLCLGVGLIVGVVTGWPVAAILAGCAAWVLPSLIGPDRAHARRLGRIEAIAAWTESLRDTLSAAAGLEQAIVATASLAPAPIRPEVGRLAERLRAGARLPAALRILATDLDDATGDLVVAALVMAAERHARHIADLLASLASAARDQASLRMRVAAGRARIRTATRVITLTTLVMAGGLVVLNHDYLHPYDSPGGQLILALVGGIFATSFWWLAHISAPVEPDRVLANRDRPAEILREVPT